MQVITEPEQNLLPEQIKEQILAGEGANDVEALRFQAETVARCSDESLLRHEINIYQLAGLLEILSERFRESGLEDFDQWLAEHHPITARKLGKPTKRHELMHLAKANAQQMIEEIGVGKAQVLNRLLKQGMSLGPTRLPSMQEQAQRDAAVMSALVETKRAQAEYDAAQSLERMQERTAQEMQRLMQQLCLNVQEELYGAMAEVLGQLETLTKSKGKANLSVTKQAAIEEALESLAKLGELGANPLNGIAGQMESLYQQQVAKLGRDASKGTKSQAQQELKTRIQTIKQELEAQLPEDSSSAGNRKLWEWLRA